MVVVAIEMRLCSRAYMILFSAPFTSVDRVRVALVAVGAGIAFARQLVLKAVIAVNFAASSYARVRGADGVRCSVHIFGTVKAPIG